MAKWTVLEPATMPQRSVNKMESMFHRRSNAPANKTPLKMAIGDPTFDGNLVTPDSTTAAVVHSLESNKYNGYSPTAGRPEARQAVAQYWAQRFAGKQAAHCKADNVVLSCGVSEALLIVLTSLCDEGDNVLIPMPCFPHYDYLSDLYAIETRHYTCSGDNNWEIDFDHLRSLADGRTKAILMTNPSNPCGSNFSRKHVEGLIRVCEELQLPLIADEIYAGLVFSGESFTSVADFDTPVPRFVVGGLSKRFNVPGYRFGWVLAVDRDGYGAKIWKGVHSMAARCLMPNSLIQHAAVKALAETPRSYYEDCAKRMEEGAMVMYSGLVNCAGLKPVRPRGSMFLSVILDFGELEDAIQTDAQFAKKLAEEENVHVFPGEPFKMPGALRITVTRPLPLLQDAVSRIRAFCERHRRC
ncbi:putative tyrosine aminotransferase [Trypanosoma grayi]|uniref:putative tyrosine aminotransferase n=1 Tax=Trypanosoma grayi TaxID=71804 RepID=UPI0004F444BC|nr:putative tyrosine aminotransferase [Trypanosoma grayi]KEG13374.1 putative tyrosine aminotransferase [Trypanosoma grayi]